MNGLPHYFLIGLIISYVYWLLIATEVTELTDGLIEVVGAYLGWLTSKNAQSKQMAFVIFTLIASLLVIMVFNPINLRNMVGLVVFITVGWLGSLSTNKGDF